MKLSMLIVQLAAVAFAALAGTAAAQSQSGSSCTIAATAPGTGDATACDDLGSCFDATNVEINFVSGIEYSVPVLPGCQSILGASVEVNLSDDETKLGGVKVLPNGGMAALFMTRASGSGYTVVYQPQASTSVQCTVPFQRTSSTACPIDDGPAPSSASSLTASAAGVTVATAAGAIAVLSAQ